MELPMEMERHWNLRPDTYTKIGCSPDPDFLVAFNHSLLFRPTHSAGTCSVELTVSAGRTINVAKGSRSGGVALDGRPSRGSEQGGRASEEPSQRQLKSKQRSVVVTITYLRRRMNLDAGHLCHKPSSTHEIVRELWFRPT